MLHFNSHAHVERDNDKGERVMEQDISTHTLTWSVTDIGAPRAEIWDNFNSHAHVERDL